MKYYQTPNTQLVRLSMQPMMTFVGSGANQEDARAPKRSLYI